jgi:hypothetical protein
VDASFPLRAVQLDLARQMETPDSIRQFIDFIARSGYNTLHLYLEGRIRTPSFPYPSADASYSLEDMRAVVAYAAGRGIEVIPQVNCFSHAEHFLHHKALQPLGELRGTETTGRFGAKAPGNTFCPSQEATYDFLGTYLAEVAAVFPSKWFHMGLDEVWDIGRCPECRRRLRDGESQDDLFLQHTLRLHKLVAGSLGKRMMMWDDMLEEYPAVLDRLPRDIVQCVWQYGEMNDRCKTHFGNQTRDWRLAEYRCRGIEFLICPVNWNPLNAESLTRHAAPYRPLGGLMTLWENSGCFMQSSYPVIAFAGRLWESREWWRGRELFRGVCEDLFGREAEAMADAVWAVLCLGNMSRQADFPPATAPLRGPITPAEVQFANVMRIARKPFAACCPSSAPGREVLEDLLACVDINLALHAWRMVTEDTGLRRAGQPAPSRTESLIQARAVLEQVRDLKARRAAQWQRLRPGLVQQDGRPLLAAAEETIAGFVAGLERDEESCGLLRVRYALPDYYGSQKVRLLVRYAGDATWHRVYEGVPKPREGVREDMPFFVFEHPLPAGRVLERVRVETWGYGGVGLLYVEYLADDVILVPDGVVATEGRVERPRAVLTDNTVWCQIGETDAHDAFLRPELAEAVHALEITLDYERDLMGI